MLKLRKNFDWDNLNYIPWAVRDHFDSKEQIHLYSCPDYSLLLQHSSSKKAFCLRPMTNAAFPVTAVQPANLPLDNRVMSYTVGLGTRLFHPFFPPYGMLVCVEYGYHINIISIDNIQNQVRKTVYNKSPDFLFITDKISCRIGHYGLPCRIKCTQKFFPQTFLLLFIPKIWVINIRFRLFG